MRILSPEGVEMEYLWKRWLMESPGRGEIVCYSNNRASSLEPPRDSTTGINIKSTSWQTSKWMAIFQFSRFHLHDLKEHICKQCHRKNKICHVCIKCTFSVHIKVTIANILVKMTNFHVILTEECGDAPLICAAVGASPLPTSI